MEKLATWGKEGGKGGPFPGESFTSCVEDSAYVMDTLEKSWAVSSAGRAPSSHGRGHRFDPCTAHHVFNKLETLIAVKKASVDKCRRIRGI